MKAMQVSLFWTDLPEDRFFEDAEIAPAYRSQYERGSSRCKSERSTALQLCCDYRFALFALTLLRYDSHQLSDTSAEVDE